MSKHKHYFSAITACILMLLLILDTKTAYQGAISAIDICMRVIIPSLFPFFVVTAYLNSALLEMRLPGMKAIGSILRIPNGCESLLVVGLIGGYPVGAQLVADACRRNVIRKDTARILLGYCCNAGPAFIFGIAGSLFSSKYTAAILWIIHLLSALITGVLLPKPSFAQSCISTQKELSIVQALKNSISVCASVCGWVIIFKIGITYLEKILTGFMNPFLSTIILGMFELSNGCLLLQNIESESLRFMIASSLLAFGGACVALQTMSVTETIGAGLYFQGKIIQTCLSLILSILVVSILFPNNEISYGMKCIIMTACGVAIYLTHMCCKKRCGNPEKDHV